MIPVLVSAFVALITAVLFLGVVLAKVSSTPLLIIFLGGIGLMVAHLTEELRHGPDEG